MQPTNLPDQYSHLSADTHALRDIQAQQAGLNQLLQERMARDAILDPYYWLTACTCSKDEQAQQGVNPYRPFPRLRYLLILIRWLLDFTIEQGGVYKSRTMMATWSASAAYTHYAATHPATKVVFQSQDEDRALHAVSNCKILWENSIPRLREKWPLARKLELQAQNKFTFANGSEIIGIVGDPMKIKSEHPTIYVQDESAIIVAGEQALNEAIATRVPRSTCISSAAPGWYADKFDRARPAPFPQNPHMEYVGSKIQPIDDHGYTGLEAADPSFAMHGMRYLRTNLQHGDYPFVELDIEADPQFRDPVRMAALERKFQPHSWFMREIKRQAHALSGATIYPEFDPLVHVVPHASIPIRGTLFMSLDPHPRTPHAALWVLIDGYGDWWVYRELWPSRIYGVPGRLRDDDEENRYTIKEYAETMVQYSEGNRLVWHEAETDNEWAEVDPQPRGEQICARYMDQAGKGFQAHSSELQTEAYSTRYARYGLQFLDPKKSHDAGEDAIHELLKPRRHDTRGMWPKLHISDRCPELILELQKLKYKQMKRVDDEKELHQQAAQYRSHMVDNLRYLATSPASYIPEFTSNRSGMDPHTITLD